METASSVPERKTPMASPRFGAGSADRARKEENPTKDSQNAPFLGLHAIILLPLKTHFFFRSFLDSNELTKGESRFATDLPGNARI
jgi:hypothetical protein